jgi:hypothetical protein
MHVSAQEIGAILAKKFFFKLTRRARGRYWRYIGFEDRGIRWEELEKDILERKGLKGLFFV